MGTPALTGKTVAILATHGFEESELTQPKAALEAAGATVQVVSPEAGSIQGLQHMERGAMVQVDRTLEATGVQEFDALMLPGGLFNPDALRTNPRALAFVRGFFEAGKPVGAICHGPQILISAGLVKGAHLTAVASIQGDLAHAGAHVTDEEVVVDHGLVTSRTPDDLPAFCAKLVEEIAEGLDEGQRQKAAA